MLISVSAAWAQQEEVAPLSLTGDVGVGYSARQDGGFNASSPAVNVNADLNGYWRDPRILLFNVSPVASYGNTLANNADVANRGNGFTASSTVLGGSPFPVTITYSRLWQQIPGYSSTGNILSSLSSSLATRNLAVDTGVFWGWIPPIVLHYDTGGNDYTLPGITANSNETHSDVSVSSSYTLTNWNLSGGYSRHNTNVSRPNLENLSGPAQLEISNSNNLYVDADRLLPLHSAIRLSAGRLTWNDDSPASQLNNTYDYRRAVVSSRPVRPLGLNLTATYDSNINAAAIAQLFGVPGGVTTPFPVFLPATNTAASALDVGGGAQLDLSRGFSLNGDGSVDKLAGSAGLSGDTLQGDINLNYLHPWRRSGTVTASYGYESLETSAAAYSTNFSTQTLRAGFHDTLPEQLLFNGTVHYQENSNENKIDSTPSINSPSHNYGFSVALGRQLNSHLKLSGDFELMNSVTEFPVNYQSHSKNFGVQVNSPSLQLSLRRTYLDGLALQVGNGLVFVNNPQDPALTALSSVLSMNSDVQTVLTGVFEPGAKRFLISGSWVRFGYDNRGVPATSADILNLTVSYRLRLLRLKAGYYSSSSQVFAHSESDYQRREIYFEVIRRFSIF